MSEEDKRPQFGVRRLENEADVFQHNAWDNVEWDEEQEKVAEEKVKINSSVTMDSAVLEKYHAEADLNWDKFYQVHDNKFFKDRHWLFTEFPELVKGGFQAQPVSNDIPSSTKILEVGCGCGNTIFPILDTNNDPNLRVYCCDFSTVAIDLIKGHPDFDKQRCFPFVMDITAPNIEIPVQQGTVDILLAIFVLSALKPDQMQSCISNLVKYLKPGGILLFRDYGRYDMAQLRFKPGKSLGENFYVRGDGTRVYFFTQDELHTLFTTAGLEKQSNLIDRRLQVNRGRQLKMYRVWIQCKYRRPLETQLGTD